MGVPMTFIKSFLGITVNPALSVLIWLILVLAALYFARKPFHRAIKAFFRIINNAMRFTASSVLLAEKRLVHRNREVLVTEGLENVERLVEREFYHINTAVTRDLQGYPGLHRQMSEVITALEENYNKTSDVAGLVIILIELGMGLFLMESLRITRLFPIIGGMDDKMRVRMVYLTLTLIAILAGVESALAFMRDRIIFDMESLQQTLTGLNEITRPASNISTIGQMVLGFVIPFALAFVAIPLESFISSSRIVIGIVVAGILRAIAFILRLIGHTGLYLGEFIIRIYDLAIFPTVWLEDVIVAKRNTVKKLSKEPSKRKLFKKANKPVVNQTIQNEKKEQPV